MYVCLYSFICILKATELCSKKCTSQSVYVYIYICIYTYIYIYVCIYIHIYIYMYSLRLVLSKEEALEMFASNPFKVSLITNKVPDGSKTTVYRCGPLIDLCMGPHISTTGKIFYFHIFGIICRYICIHIHKYVYLYINIHRFIYIYIYVCIYINI
jgi:hypothetical protein